jgi:DNA-binding response OmpR family regulator
MKTILVIDDEENIRRLYHDELTDAGYRVLTASSWDEARPLLAKGVPDLVTLDIRLGQGPDGLDVLRLLKERSATLPVIILTAYSEFRADFSVWAADAYVVKSADLTELRSHIERILGTPPPA